MNKPPQQFVFGSIISGTYANWKEDPKPTILCLGNYQHNGKWYIHGFQMHLMGSSLSSFLEMVKRIKMNRTIVPPKVFYNNIKLNFPIITANCYRTYHAEMCDFKTINPGFSNIPQNYCYPLQDGRDNYIVNYLNINQKPMLLNMNVNSTALRENITKVINTIKVW